MDRRNNDYYQSGNSYGGGSGGGRRGDRYGSGYRERRSSRDGDSGRDRERYGGGSSRGDSYGSGGGGSDYYGSGGGSGSYGGGSGGYYRPSSNESYHDSTTTGGTESYRDDRRGGGDGGFRGRSRSRSRERGGSRYGGDRYRGSGGGGRHGSDRGRGGGRGGGGGMHRIPKASENTTECRSNIIHLKIKNPKMTYYVYTVSIQGSRGRHQSRFVGIRLFGLLLRELNVDRQGFWYSFEGTQAYTIKPIPGLDLTEPYTLQQQHQGCTLTVINVQKYGIPDDLYIPDEDMVDEEDEEEDGKTPADRQQFITFMSLAIRNQLTQHFKPWGRDHVDNGGLPLSSQYDVDVYRAYNVEPSVVESLEDPEKFEIVLTADVKAKVIRTKSCLDNIFDAIRTNDLSRVSAAQINDVKRQFEGKTVINKKDKRTYIVDSVDFEMSPDKRFIPNMPEVSHTEYFSRKKTILQYGHVPVMLECKSRNQSIYLPPELVSLNDISDDTKKNMPKIASLKPEDMISGHDIIKNKLTSFTPDKANVLEVAGFSIEGQKFRQVKCRLIDKPRFSIGVETGVLEPNLKNRLKNPDYGVRDPSQRVKVNVVLVIHQGLGRENSMRDWYIQNVANPINGYNSPFVLGTAENVDLTVISHSGNVHEHIDAVKNLVERGHKQEFFLIDCHYPRSSNNKDETEYKEVKLILGQHGVPSQFINFRNNDLHRNSRGGKNLSVLTNINKQILAKLGQMIWRAQLPNELPLPALFIGIDVYHAPRTYRSRDDNTGKTIKERRNSVAAIVLQYLYEENGQLRRKLSSDTQKQVEEGTEDNLEPMIRQSIHDLFEDQTIKPVSCFVWRDGVGDNSIERTQSTEGSEIRKLLAEKLGEGVCSQTFIVCQKRVSIKFLAKENEIWKSLQEGTCIEEIGHPDFEKTFYIIGNAPPYSTPKPTRFIVAYEDDILKGVPLPELTYTMCFDYPNWVGAIKIPAPTKMAGKLAELAGIMRDNGATWKMHLFRNKLFFL